MIKCVFVLGFTYQTTSTQNVISEAMAYANCVVGESDTNTHMTEDIVAEGDTNTHMVVDIVAEGNTNTHMTVDIVAEGDTNQHMTEDTVSEDGINSRMIGDTVSEDDVAEDTVSEGGISLQSSGEWGPSSVEDESDLGGVFQETDGEESDDSGYDKLNTPVGIPPDNDTCLTELERIVEDFDYEAEIFDWENFRGDLDDIEDMDFSRFLT